jgi:SynChlorMet cassette protein ScmC
MAYISGSLTLADGITWRIEAAEESAVEAVSFLVEVMNLRRPISDAQTSDRDFGRRLLVSSVGDRAESAVCIPSKPAAEAEALAGSNLDRTSPPRRLTWSYLSEEDEGNVHCIMQRYGNDSPPVEEAMIASLALAAQAQERGGLLIHGALAERDGIGVILAGPGGVGKTWASQRFSTPWRSLCDDAALVVRDAQGEYRAHPWPTWSNFIFHSYGGVWDVQYSVPLRGIFFLSQDKVDKVESIGDGEKLCRLFKSVEQASHLMSWDRTLAEKRVLHMQWFDNARELAKAVPGLRLHMSLDGDFPREIELALLSRNGAPS